MTEAIVKFNGACATGNGVVAVIIEASDAVIVGCVESVVEVTC